MNKYILKGVIGLVALGGLASCSEDYLDLKPVTGITAATAASSAETMGMAVNAIGRQMYMYHESMNWLGFNGEASFATFYGDFMGQDDYLYAPGRIGAGQLVNMEANTMLNAYMAILGWQYCYGLLAEVNDVLAKATNPEGAQTDINFVTAQLLTYRAHCYHRLLQVYAPRWEDSNNGEALTVVLRTEPTTDPMPLSTMNEVLDQIYADLTKAIELYDNSGSARRGSISEPDRNIACGIFARAALLKKDWKTAQKYAHEARQGYSIMSANEYKDGFCVANSEWMWTNSDLQNDIVGYVAWGSWWACNGPYQYIFAIGAGAMNKQLYDLIPQGDIRRDLYLMPDKLPGFENAFYDDKVVAIDRLNLYNPGANRQMARALLQFTNSMQPASGSQWPIAYDKPSNVSDDDMGEEAGTCIPFGAQFKMYSVDTYGSDQFPFMRAAEMYLTEAEAAAELGDLTTARNILTEINAKRNPNYSCTASTKEAMIEEVRLQRRIELWGEGFNWFDFKRWNIAVDRKAWIPGDPTSGNIPSTAAVRIEPSSCNKWVVWIPNYEVNYNPFIKESDLVR